jgi:hypothetical protein
MTDAPQDPDDDSRRHDSLLWGPLEAERRRQAQAAARRKQPDYSRIATNRNVKHAKTSRTLRSNRMSALTNYQNGGQTFPTISTTMLGKIAARLNPTDPQQCADRQLSADYQRHRRRQQRHGSRADTTRPEAR